MKDVLDVLEPRLNRVRFLDGVAGYQALIDQSSDKTGRTNIHVPSAEAIQKIMNSFRELCRLGDMDAQGLKITTGRCAAGVSAFARWSAEVPPVICDNRGQVFRPAT